MRTVKKYAVCLVIAFLANFSGLLAQGVDLSIGQWLRIRVVKEGVYKLTGQELRKAGLTTNSKDPRKLMVFTHQGAMLPELSRNLIHGTKELPVLLQGENDGILDDNDNLIFYAATPHPWFFSGGTWRHQSNFYDDYTYLYIGFGDQNGKRITTTNELGTSQMVVDKSEWLVFHELELENPVHMGRTWLGEKMGNETLTRNLKIDLPAGANDSVDIRLSVAGGIIDGTGTVNFGVNGKTGAFVFSGINTDYAAFDLQERYLQVTAPTGQVQAQFTLSRPNTKSNAWIDFLEIAGTQPMTTANGPVVLRNRQMLQKSVVEIRTQGNQAYIWNVSDKMNPVALTVNSSGNAHNAIAGASLPKSAFAVFDPDNTPKPEVLGLISGPQLLQASTPELLIITHPKFKSAAMRLADLRKKNQKYKVQVVELQDIYNRFSTSQQDIVAVRDFVRCLYQQSLSSATPLKYVLLMGAASYDMKNRVKDNTNFIPTYQYDSPNKGANFCLDDFFGYLDSLAGDPSRGNNQLQVSVGRIPCRSEAEADAMVSKLERYDSPESLGEWRSNIAYVTDDVDISWETVFTAESEKYARNIDTIHPYINVNKIFADAFKQVSTGNTEKYPDVNAAIDRNMQNGCLFMNYQGHGGPAGWAQEAMLDVPMIKAWNNRWKMPVMFTATCEFSLYDDPREQSAGEQALLNPNGGPIALMSTTRLVFVSGNMAINNDFWTNYGFPKPNEPIPALGDIFKRLKNRPGVTSEDNKFALLGDPSMPLAFPKHKVILDSINHQTANGFKDTLKAFSIVELKGHIEERLKGKYSTFNGQMWVRILDKPITRKTLVNDQIGQPIPYLDQSSFIYKGTVSVTNGDFKVVFTVPKDIAYNVDFGKMMFYAHNQETDAAGGYRVLIGGSESNVVAGNKGPDVKVYINDATFRYGEEVQPNANMFIRVFDEDGLNATGAGIGRDMICILDKGTPQEKIIILNDFFTYDLNSYTSGTIKMPLPYLTNGKHSLHVKVWDIFNNSGEGWTEFTIGNGSLKVLEHAAFPNPFSDAVGIRFRHNMPGADFKVELSVMDGSGKTLHQQESQISGAAANEIRLSWPGSTTFDNQVKTGLLPNGIYFYKVKLTAAGSSAIFGGKMIKN